jgi:competence protein ComEC
VRRDRPWHHLADSDIVLISITAVVGVWTSAMFWPAAVGSVLLLFRRRLICVVLCAAIGMVGGARSHAEWQAAHPHHLGAYRGWATVVGDPAPFGRGMRVTLEVGGERFDAWVYGSPRRRLVERQAGQVVYVEGQRRDLGAHARRAQVRHVVGRFDLSVAGDWGDGAPLYVASTRIRIALRHSAESAMTVDEAALFTGLVIGDDARQPETMVTAFRASGLSHLTAVSGQNVAFVLAAASPLLRRLRPWWRWAATIGLIGWFTALTRFEPSVLRAGLMAMLSSLAFVLGRPQSVVRLLACTVGMLVLIDPLLVWSVGFWLSTGATAGVCVVGPWLVDRLPGPGWLRAPLSVTLGAQVGVALPSLLVFHRLPLVSLPANLLAVPVAGFVMLYGIPAGLAAAVLPPIARLTMEPAVLGTRWVATVAYLGERLEPPTGWALCGWSAVVSALVVRLARRSSALVDEGGHDSDYRGAAEDVPI